MDIKNLHKRAIEYTKSLLDRQVIERIYQLIKNAKYIEIYGTGINFSLAEIYSLNFEEEGVISKAYNSLNPMHLQYLRQRKPNDTVCIYLTHASLQYVFNIFTSLKLISNYSYLEETTKAVDKFKMGE